jgi:hypothetical protein
MLLVFGPAGCGTKMSLEKQANVPTSVEIPPDKESIIKVKKPAEVFISLLNRAHPGNKIGWRLWEYEPIAYGKIPEKSEKDAETIKAVALEKEYAARPGVFVHTVDVGSRKGWAPQSWTYYIVPTADGFDVLWVITTGEKGLNEYYLAQQCLRFSGKTNQPWRRIIAEAPDFSEYDLWKMQDDSNKPRSSLSFVHRNGRWEAIEPVKEQVFCRTPLGLKADTARTSGDLAKLADMKSSLFRQWPTHFKADIDCGLITRSDINNKWVCAIYLERTTHISNHHPADCLHTYVNIGPIPPHGKRAIRGKIYWMKTSKNKLFELWQKDWRL